MAKVGFWLRGARGKLAGSVLHKSPNGTIAREKVDPKNPKTFSQATQRAIFATVTRTAKILRPIVSNSFDGAKNGENDVREFVKANVIALRKAYEGSTHSQDCYFIRKGENYNVPNPLVISQGSLGSVNGLMLDSNAWVHLAYKYGDRDYLTVGDLQSGLNPNIGPGTQLTFVACIPSDPDRESVNDLFWTWGRVVLRDDVTSDTVFLNEISDVASTKINSLAIDPSKTDGFPVDELNSPFLGDGRECNFGIYVDANHYYLGGNQSNEREAYAMGIIVSNYDKNTGKWLHSTSTLGCASDMDVMPGLEDNAKVNIPTYMAAAKAASSSDWYTEQSDGLGNTDFEPTTLNQGFSGSVQVSGYSEKVLNFEGSNSYGPVPEGSNVDLNIRPLYGSQIAPSSVVVKIGEQTVNAEVVRITEYYYDSNGIRHTGAGFHARVHIPQGTASTANINCTFQYKLGIVEGGLSDGGFRVAVQLVQA